jgi:NAD(P)-dependent dehydrogenase (short-subunit alcohol dehydrogenase family)
MHMMKAIVIGATGTIGREVVKAFTRAGYEVVESSRNGGLKANLEKPETVEELLKETGKVDVIVSAAGYAAMGRIEELSADDFKHSLNSKLMGQVYLVQKGLPYLNAGGSIVITGGIFAYNPFPGTSAIAMVNLALECFTRALALELTGKRKVLVIHPPLVAETASLMGMDPTPYPPASLAGQAYLQAVEKGKPGEAFFMSEYNPQQLEG